MSEARSEKSEAGIGAELTTKTQRHKDGQRRIVRVFPRRTTYTPDDALSFVGPPPLIRPEADEVHVSVTFTWDMPEAERLAEHWQAFYPVVRIGGPACGQRGGEFVGGRYVKHGVTFTSDGCPNRCDFCMVRHDLVEHESIVPGWIVQDDNLTACSDRHLNRVFAMLRRQRRRICFAGGLEAARLNARWIERLQSVGIEQLFTAYDRPSDGPDVKRAAELLRAKLPRRKCHCYVLIGKGDDTLDAARHRCEQVWEWGLWPRAMLFRDESGTRKDDGWRQLQRTFMRPAATATYFGARTESGIGPIGPV
jgi:hypothetical protein